MKIIDAHHHLWCPVNDTDDIGYVWLRDLGAEKPFGDPTPIQRDYLLDEFLLESNSYDLVGTIHIQADGAINDPLSESKWIERIACKNGFPNAQVGFIDFCSTESEQILDNYHNIVGVRGVRQILSYLETRPDISFCCCDYLKKICWRERFSGLVGREMSFDLQLYPEQMLEAAHFFAEYSSVPLVIDHAGSPYNQSKKGIRYWREGLEQLSSLPHCYIKLSGFGMFDKYWNASSIYPLFSTIMELFGPERVMFGSNFPVDKLTSTYDYIVEQLLVCAQQYGLDSFAINKIFHQTAQTFYRIE